MIIDEGNVKPKANCYIRDSIATKISSERGSSPDSASSMTFETEKSIA